MQFVRRKHARFFKRTSVRGAGLQLAFEQPAIEFKRPLPLFKCGIKWLPESSGPHLHCATSCGFVCESFAFFASFAVTCFSLLFLSARDRDGNPKIRMNPAASF